MKTRKNIRAFALPAVMVVSVLLMTVIAMALSLLSLDGQTYSEYHMEKQQMMDLESAMVIYSHDSTMFVSADSVMQFLPWLSEDTGITVCRKEWGLYECITASDRNGNIITRLFGRNSDSAEEAAFWICDRNRALTLGRDARLSGTIFIPPNGINYTLDIHERYEKIPEKRLKISSPQLPATTHGLSDMILNLMNSPTGTERYRGGQICNSFRSKTVTVALSPDDSIFRIRGNVIMYGDNVTIAKESEIHDAILCARKVTVSNGFKGRLQIFCRDTVSIGSGAALEWPSGIFVASDSGRPHVELASSSNITGYVAVTGADDDPGMSHPGYVQDNYARLSGLLYADCSCRLAGTIKGAAYVRDCFHSCNGMKYPGTVHAAEISRNSGIAFPILMQGKYKRKAIKDLR